VDRALGLASTAALARLLTPADFGIVGIAVAYAGLFDVLTSFGFDWALVRHPQPDRRHYDTAFTLRLGVTLLAAAVMVASAWVVAGFYGDARLPALIAVVALSGVVSALENVGLAEYRRQLRFDVEFRQQMAGKFAGLAVAVGVAVTTRSYWALVLGTLAGRTASVAASYVMHPYRPRLGLSARSELFSFSMWLQLNNLLTMLKDRFSALVLGRFDGSRAVGLYGMAYELAYLSSSELVAPINRVFFSRYAQLQGDPVRLREGYLRVVGVIWLAALPLAVGIWLTADYLVLLLLGEGWADAVPVLKLLAVAGALAVVAGNAGYVFVALGAPRVVTAIKGLGLALLVPAMLLLVPPLGTQGAAYAAIASTAVMVPLHVGLLARWLRIGLGELAAPMWRPILGCAVMVPVVRFAAPAAVPASTIGRALEILLLAGIGSATYVAAVALAWWVAGRPDGAERDLAGVPASLLEGRGTGAASASADAERAP
jgi:O-antigen/teichoic acid export membrane protein